MDPNSSKATTVNERVVAACAESQSTSRGPKRTRFLAVQAAIRAKMPYDKKSLGKRDATLSHRDTFSRKIIPGTDKRLDEEGMSRLKPRMKKVEGTLMSDGCQSTSNKPVINVIHGVDGILTLRLAADCSDEA
jgi:hypothetical protein